MFKKTIEALKAAEAAAQEELDALFVPYDPQTGTGGVYWHAAGSGLLQNLTNALAATRADFEKRQANQDAVNASAETPSPEPTSEPTEPAGEPTTEPAPEPAAEPAPEPPVEVTA